MEGDAQSNARSVSGRAPTGVRETVRMVASRDDGTVKPSAPVPGNGPSSVTEAEKPTSLQTPSPYRSPTLVSSRKPSDLRQTSTMTSRSSRHGSIKHGAHHKRLKKLPFIRYPKHLAEGQTEEDVSGWLDEEDEASEWLNLLYDLAVVAVLTVFSSTHELSEPYAIPIFLSYFAVLSWLWTSQVYYDIRFQAEDGWHRWVKSLQLVLFVYIGAASGNWDPGSIRDPGSIPDVSQADYTTHIASMESWQTVLIAYIVSRALLAIQYIISGFIGWRAGRKTVVQQSQVLGLCASIILIVLAVAIPGRSSGTVIAKIVLFYLGLAAEIFSGWLLFYRRLAIHSNTRQIGARYGAFTLIIMGEGFISITRAFSLAISGLSDSSSTTYGQVWLAIGIVYLLWCFLFSRFRVEDSVNPRRAIVWESLHFALHFSLLLLLAALVNVIVMFAFADGIATVTTEFSRTAEHLHAGTSLNSTDEAVIHSSLSRLPLIPSYEDEYDYLLGIHNDPDRTLDPGILMYQYYGQAMIQTTSSYGIDVSDEMLDLVQQLYALNTTFTNVTSEQEARYAQAQDLLYDVIQTPVDDELSGILWLFPSAGGVLVLSALRSMTWYRYPTMSHWIIHVPQLVMGFVLALLGLLDIGKHAINVRADPSGYFNSTNPMYHVLGAEMPIAIVFLVYWVVWVGTVVVLDIRHRRKGDIFGDDAGDKAHNGETGAGGHVVHQSEPDRNRQE